MRIAVLELSSKNHSSLVDNWINIGDKKGWEVSVIVSNDILDNLSEKGKKSDNLHIFNTKSPLSFFNFFKFLKGFDKVVVTSVQSDFIFFALLFVFVRKTTLTIHNINAWTGRVRKDSIKYFIKYLIRKSIFFLAKDFVVSSFEMKSYLGNKTSKDINIVPFKLSKHNCWNKENKFITYPGICSINRKRYDTFFHLAKNFPELSFVLLGRSEDKESERWRNMLDSLGNVKTFTEYVNIEDFEFYIQNSMIIFGDIVTDYTSSEFIEKYGVTKDSGLSYFSIEYGIPLMVNHDFSNLEGLESCTNHFKNQEEAVDVLKNFISSTEITYNMHNFSLDVVAKRITKF